jgi:OOP family OmpA-OmpF porin
VAVYGLYFDTDMDAIKPIGAGRLKSQSFLKNDPSLRLHVVGHTDNLGKPDYNLGLSHVPAAS